MSACQLCKAWLAKSTGQSLASSPLKSGMPRTLAPTAHVDEPLTVTNWLTADTALQRINGSHRDWTGRGYSILKRRHSSYPTLIYFHYPERISFSLVSFQARQLYLDSPLILISLISMWPKLNAIFSSSVEPTVLMISAMSVT